MNRRAWWPTAAGAPNDLGIQHVRGTDTPTLVLVAEAYALLALAAVIVFGGVRATANAVRFTYTGSRYLVMAVGLWQPCCHTARLGAHRGQSRRTRRPS